MTAEAITYATRDLLVPGMLLKVASSNAWGYDERCASPSYDTVFLALHEPLTVVDVGVFLRDSEARSFWALTCVGLLHIVMSVYFGFRFEVLWSPT